MADNTHNEGDWTLVMSERGNAVQLGRRVSEEAPTEHVAEVIRLYPQASSRLVCQLDASRRELMRLERHADRMLRIIECNKP